MKNQAQAKQIDDTKPPLALVVEEVKPVETEVLDVTMNIDAAVAKQNAKPNLRIVKPHPLLATLIENGIPVRKATFHRTVLFDYTGGTPEYAFYSKEWSKDVRPNRVANMWYTPHGLICEQNGHFKIVPLATVSDTMV